MNLYSQRLMDHYRHKRNYGTLQEADFSSGKFNPSCGDSICFEGAINKSTITALAFEGKGCVISQATASLLSEHCKNKSIDAVLCLDSSFILTLLGIPLGPTRLTCALLPLQALQEGLTNYTKDNHARS